MIKISIDEISKKEIEKNFWEDANSNTTGLIQVLNTTNAKNILMNKHRKIYDVLYDAATGDINVAEVKELLLADRQSLKKYIGLFGNYSSNKILADELLDNIFRYDRYSKRRVAVEVLKKMKVTVCPYCNRQYIFTLSNGHVRPQFDHYYPKSRYPYLALSLYNMIPSCSICNMAKSSLDTLKEPILYPFVEEMGSEAKFVIKGKQNGNFVRMLQGISNEFIIDLNTTNARNEAVILNQMTKLHLNDLYNEHKGYVMDIIKSKYVNSPERINELFLSFPTLFDSYEDVKNLLYMTNIQKEAWGNRPLSKLTYDIDSQLEKGSIEEE
ncbi:hypothetical protein [Dorea formicigenerans]|jgi:hypothetical protein|uniref:hypothetical protein n=1 Tax=Dorea formicigenerans TaxID=39486 RepID=UPI000E43C1F3|nr:hypothetical protein [Dorea formicigenerans]RGJ64380.1 hypothetical protein DXD50_08845 [Dorea formicigenerans]